MKTTILLALITMAASHAAAENALRLSLTLEPAATIPCVPVTFRLAVTNTGSTPVRLERTVRLEVAPDAGPTFILGGGGGDAEQSGAPLPFEPTLDGIPAFADIPAGGQLRLTYVASSLSPPWFGDPRMQRPGTYRLRLIMGGGEDSGPEEPVISNETLLVIGTPVAMDGEVWKLIKDEDSPCGALHRRASELWNLYPGSTYTGMTLRPASSNDLGAEMDSLRAALAKNPPAGVGDDLKLSLASGHLILMNRAIQESDLQKASEHSLAARALYEDLLRRETDVNIRQQAKKRLHGEVLTLAELEDLDRRRRGLGSDELCERVGVASLREEIAFFVAHPPSPNKKLDKLEKAVKSLDGYAAEIAKQQPDTAAALGALEKAANDVEASLKDDDVRVENGQKWGLILAVTAELHARRAVEKAASDPSVDRNKLGQAREKLEEGHSAQEKGDFKKAISRYRDAVKKAYDASSARRSQC